MRTSDTRARESFRHGPEGFRHGPEGLRRANQAWFSVFAKVSAAGAKLTWRENDYEQAVAESFRAVAETFGRVAEGSAR